MQLDVLDKFPDSCSDPTSQGSGNPVTLCKWGAEAIFIVLGTFSLGKGGQESQAAAVACPHDRPQGQH